VAKWCLGFDELRDYIQAYSPQKGHEITWVPADKIVEAARLYATLKPAQSDLGAGNVPHGPFREVRIPGEGDITSHHGQSGRAGRRCSGQAPRSC